MLGAILYVSLMAAFVAGSLSIWGMLADDERTSEVLSLAAAIERSAHTARDVGNVFPAGSGLQKLALETMRERLDGATTIRTPWGGQMTVFAGDDITSDLASATAHRRRFVMQISDLPQRGCTGVAVAMLAYHRAETVYVSGTGVADVSDVLNNCSGTSTTVSIVYQ